MTSYNGHQTSGCSVLYSTIIKDCILSCTEVYGYKGVCSLLALTFHSYSILKEGNSYEGNANI